MANIEELRAVGKQLVTMAYAIADGIDLNDLMPAQALVAGLLAAADDIQEDADSALLEIASGILAEVAAKRRVPETSGA